MTRKSSQTGFTETFSALADSLALLVLVLKWKQNLYCWSWVKKMEGNQFGQLALSTSNKKQNVGKSREVKRLQFSINYDGRNKKCNGTGGEPVCLDDK